MVRIKAPTRLTRQLAALAGSLATHFLVILLLLNVRFETTSQFTNKSLREAAARQGRRIVWMGGSVQLPRIVSTKRIGKEPQLQAPNLRSETAVIAEAEQAKSTKRFAWEQEPTRELPETAPAPDVVQVQAAAKVEPRKFVPPARTVAEPPPDTPILTDLPALSTVVLNVTPAMEMIQVTGSLPGSFAKAPILGEVSSGEPIAGLSVPGVAVAGATAAVVPRPAVSAAPSPPAPSYYEMQLSSATAMFSAPLHPSARNIPAKIEARFTGRIAYVLIIPKPNLPEYGGTWTIWFAEPAGQIAPGAGIRAPVPVRRIRGTSVAGPSAQPQKHVLVVAKLGASGRLEGITPLPGENPALAALAQSDLPRWEFRPASKNGRPVDVEVILDIAYQAPASMSLESAPSQ